MWPNLPRWHKHQFVSRPLRWAHAFERTVDEDIARADVVQLEDRVKIASENHVAR
jgi:hypothetical protein